MWDTGSVGSVDGTYALKIVTGPMKDHQAVSLKRITFRKACPIRLEANRGSVTTRSLPSTTGTI